MTKVLNIHVNPSSPSWKGSYVDAVCFCCSCCCNNVISSNLTIFDDDDKDNKDHDDDPPDDDVVPNTFMLSSISCLYPQWVIAAG